MENGHPGKGDREPKSKIKNVDNLSEVSGLFQ